jgi:hypothetical protein
LGIREIEGEKPTQNKKESTGNEKTDKVDKDEKLDVVAEMDKEKTKTP